MGACLTLEQKEVAPNTEKTNLNVTIEVYNYNQNQNIIIQPELKETEDKTISKHESIFHPKRINKSSKTDANNNPIIKYNNKYKKSDIIITDKKHKTENATEKKKKKKKQKIFSSKLRRRSSTSIITIEAFLETQKNHKSSSISHSKSIQKSRYDRRKHRKRKKRRKRRKRKKKGNASSSSSKSRSSRSRSISPTKAYINKYLQTSISQQILYCHTLLISGFIRHCCTYHPFHFQHQSSLSSISSLSHSPTIHPTYEQFYDSITHIIILYYPRKYKIYGIGSNEHAQLGLGHCSKLTKYQYLEHLSLLCDHPDNVYISNQTLFIHTMWNELFCVGRNFHMYPQKIIIGFKKVTNKNNSETNNNSDFDFRFEPFDSSEDNETIETIATNEEICVVSNGVKSQHMFIITKSEIAQNSKRKNTYKYYGIGKCEYGEFGNNRKKMQTNLLLPVNKYGINCDVYELNITPYYMKYISDVYFHKLRVIKIECGTSHTLFLIDNGTVYSCGNNLYAQCGQCMQQYSKIPKMIPYLKKVSVIDIKCGVRHNLLLSVTHELYVFGENYHGQLGMGDDYCIEYATAHPWFHPSKKMSADVTDVELLMDMKNNDSRDEQMNIEIMEIRCGFYHSLCVDSYGKCYLFGSNSSGQIGNGNSTHINGGMDNDTIHIHNKRESNLCTVKKPFLFQNENNKAFEHILIEDGSCGDQHTVLLTTDNQVLTFGSNVNNECSSKLLAFQVDIPYLLTKEEIGITEKYSIEKVLAANRNTLIICDALRDRSV